MNAPATKPSGRGASTTRSNPRTVWWRALERAWEEKLRAAETIEQDYERWRRAEPLVLNDADRAALQILGENLPRIWHVATTTAAERKRLLRFIIREVVLDQKRAPG